MAVVLVVAGGLLLGALQGDPVPVWAESVGVDPADLQGALNSTGVDAYTYLLHEGLIDPPAPVRPPLNAAMEARLDCIQRVESHNVASATNRQSGAAGLFQFLPGTWRSTPEGKAGLSPYDPVAARSAARWMLSQGRAREWVAVTAGGC